MTEKSKLLNELKEECLNCRKCKIGGQFLGENICNVFSNMCLKSNIMVIGQNPGKNEVEQGKPFVGQSGKFFDKCIQEVLNVSRDKFYISNTVRCLSPDNRGIYNEEMDNCRYFLDKEIEIIKPSIIVTLGASALEQVTGRHGISKLHGKIIPSIRYKVMVLPMYHPSPLNINRKDIRDDFIKDLSVLKDYL